MQTPSLPGPVSPFAAIAKGSARKRRHLEQLSEHVTWLVPSYVAICLSLKVSASPYARWKRFSPVFGACAELAGAQASDPQAECADKLAEAIAQQLSAGLRPEAELRKLICFVLEEAHPALIPFCEPLFEVLDNNSRLRLKIDLANLIDADYFVSAAYSFAQAFHHGDGSRARNAMAELCSFICDEWL